MKTEISLIIPVYNAEKTIEYTLKSIRNSSCKPNEVILVDDCSTDNTINVLRKYKYKIIQNKTNQGQSVSRNKAAKLAKNSLLLFIDSDVELKKDTIKCALELLKKNKDICAVTANFDDFNRFNNFLSQYKIIYLVFLYRNNPKIVKRADTAFLLIQKKAFFSVDGLDETIKKSQNEDLKLGLELTKRGYKILFDKNLKIIHNKHLSLKEFLKIQYFRSRNRAIIILTNIFFRKINAGSTEPSFKFSLLAAPLIYLSIIFSFYITPLLLISILILYFIVNNELIMFFYKKKGFIFSLASYFMLLFDMSLCFIGIVSGTFNFLRGERI